MMAFQAFMKSKIISSEDDLMGLIFFNTVTNYLLFIMKFIRKMLKMN